MKDILSHALVTYVCLLILLFFLLITKRNRAAFDTRDGIPGGFWKKEAASKRSSIDISDI